MLLITFGETKVHTNLMSYKTSKTKINSSFKPFDKNIVLQNLLISSVLFDKWI